MALLPHNVVSLLLRYGFWSGFLKFIEGILGMPGRVLTLFQRLSWFQEHPQKAKVCFELGIPKDSQATRVFFLGIYLLLLCIGNLAHASSYDDPNRFCRVKAWMGSFQLQGDGHREEHYSFGSRYLTSRQQAQGTLVLDKSNMKDAFLFCYFLKPNYLDWEGKMSATVSVDDEWKDTDTGEDPPCGPILYLSTWKGGGKTSSEDPPPPGFDYQVPKLRFRVDEGTYELRGNSPLLDVPFARNDCGDVTNELLWYGWGSGQYGGGIGAGDYEYDILQIPIKGYTLKGDAQLQTGGAYNDPLGDHIATMIDDMLWTYSWTLTGVEECIECPIEIFNASTIGAENQSLGESIDIVGTPFYLHYQSDRTQGRFLANGVAVAHAKGLGGWSLNAHHVYDPAVNTLYLGSGQRRDSVSLGQVKQGADGRFYIGSADGREVYVFGPKGLHLQTLHALTGAPLLKFTYDNKKRLIKITDADGNATSIQRNIGGKPVLLISPYDHITKLTVNADGYLAKVTNPAAEVITLVTTADGLLTRFTNPRKKTSQFSYDADGRLIQDQDAAGGYHKLVRTETNDAFTVTRSTVEGRAFEYGVTPHVAAGEDRKIKDAAGLETTMARDANGSRLASAPDGSQSSNDLGDDPRFGRSAAFAKHITINTPSGLNFASATARTVVLNNPNDLFSLATLTETVELNGRAYKSIYDGASLTFTSTSPMGRSSQTVIDAKGRIVKESTPGIFLIEYFYDARGRLTAVTQGSGMAARTTQFNYDSFGFLESSTDALERTISFTRDAAGRITQQTLPDGRAIGFGYNASGNTISITPPDKPIHNFSFTNVDLTKAYTAPMVGTEANQTRYAYNLDRDLTQIAYPGGKTLDLDYDLTGRLITQTIARGSIHYGYDAATGNLSTISAPDDIVLSYTYDGQLLTGETMSGPIAGHIGYTFDNDFRVKAITVNNEPGTDYLFDKDSLLIRAGIMNLSRNAQNGLLTGTTLDLVKDKWTYNGFAEPVDYQATFNDNISYKVHYARDRIGRIKMLVETIGGKKTTYAYSYDKAGRLFKVTRNGVLSAQYAYDSNGNRLTVTRGGKSVTGKYDAQDRLIQYGGKIYTYTANGELKSRTAAGKTTSYNYDALGNLTTVTLVDGTKIVYWVDGRNRRIGKKVNGSLVQGFLFDDQLMPIAELNGSGSIVSRFIYATHVNVPDYMIKNGTTYRIVTDHLGSPRLVLDAATGAVAQRMDYDEFGRILQDTNPGFQPFGFAGGLYDRDTKLVRFGARDYDAEIGRWTAKDPVRFEGGDTNIYSYVQGDPLNLVDPEGLGPFKIIKICAKGFKVVRKVGFKEAVRALRRGEDVLSSSRQAARQVADAAGGGAGRAVKDLPHGGQGYNPHYHTFNRAGGHSFFQGAKAITAPLTLPYWFEDCDCFMKKIAPLVDLINPLATPNDLIEIIELFGD